METRALLIGGSSHAGKSTLAAHIAAERGWACRSTDKLARHPGRPWAPEGSTVPPHVAEHYLNLSHEARLDSVLAHYRTMRPLIENVIRDAQPVVLEGSALWPETVATFGVPAVWLTGPERMFRERIHTESRYAQADEPGRRMIDNFLERTLRYDRAMREAVGRLGLPLIEVDGRSLDDLARRL